MGVPTGFYFGPLPIPPSGYYVHHPPLLPLLVTGTFGVFGEHEWAARLVPVVASLATVILLWLLLRDLAGERAATLGAAVMACQPMLLYIGQMVNFEPVTLPVMLAVLLCYRRQWRRAMLACLAVGLWLCWHVHLFALVLIIVWWRRERRLALITLGWVLLSLVSFVVFTRLARPDAWASEWEAASRRVIDRGEVGYSFWQWLGVQRTFFSTRFVPVVWVLVCAGGVWAWRQTVVWVAVLTATLVVAGLPNFSYIHDYAGFYFLAPVGLLGGLALEALWKRRSGAVWVAIVLVVIAGWGVARSQWLRQMPFCVLRWGGDESRELIPRLGREINRSFPETMDVQLNFLHVYGPHLAYYAQRQLFNGLSKFEHESDDGGVIWLDAPGGAELAASLPAREQRLVKIDGYRFSFWTPQASR